MFDTTSLTEVKGPTTYYAAESKFDLDSHIANINHTIGPFQSNFKIGEGLFNANKLRVITEMNITCTSNVISDILNPEIHKSDGALSTEIEAFRKNPGGFVGFNIYKIPKQIWIDKSHNNKSNLLNQESLFKSNTFHNAEEPYKVTNIARVLKEGEDLVLFPHFDFIHSGNANLYYLQANKQ